MLMELLIVLFFGLCFGSFVTCASYRLPLDIDVVRKPSFCPSCNTKLGFKDLWPVFSWLFSGGKCRHCKTPVSARYPLTELTTAALFWLVYSVHGIGLVGAIFALMAVMLMIMIVADLEHYIIPDTVHVVLFPLGIVYHYVSGTLSVDTSLSIAVMGGLALLLHYGYSALRGQVMLGFGDVKFFAVVGAWLPLAHIPFYLFLSGVLGVVLGLVWRALGKGPVFPFGPALAMALLLCGLFPQYANFMYYIK
jgi:leader peptidase (prepilin peptidase) / N-methyltransferase